MKWMQMTTVDVKLGRRTSSVRWPGDRNHHDLRGENKKTFVSFTQDAFAQHSAPIMDFDLAFKLDLVCTHELTFPPLR